MLSSFTIKNFKSIVDLTLELGRFNVFIGENGGGKTNILEALAMAAGLVSNRLANEDLIARGVRVAKPSLTTSAFADLPQSDAVELAWTVPVAEEHGSKHTSVQYKLVWQDNRWINPELEALFQQVKKDLEFIWLEDFIKNSLPDESISLLSDFMMRVLRRWDKSGELPLSESLSILSLQGALKQYAIYCANTLALRGLQVESRREPLGLFGEGLDVAIAQLSPEVREELVEHARVVAWLDDIDVDREGRRKLEGYKLGRSQSDLYFIDRFMSEDNQLFSAENANEGILHVLFHLVLFMHPGTPKLFAIDNIETALNPHLLRHLIKTLVQLAKTHDRQALVTTHNPAALDGLNLHDDDQRLFVVYRDDEGHTRARRIKIKPDSPPDGPKLKLSEMWTRGLLGAIPTHF